MFWICLVHWICSYSESVLDLFGSMDSLDFRTITWEVCYDRVYNAFD